MVAGITVGLTVIPQALAYAGIANLDPAVSRTPLYSPSTSKYLQTKQKSLIFPN